MEKDKGRERERPVWYGSEMKKKLRDAFSMVASSEAEYRSDR